jgi:hypothetical protein
MSSIAPGTNVVAPFPDWKLVTHSEQLWRFHIHLDPSVKTNNIPSILPGKDYFLVMRQEKPDGKLMNALKALDPTKWPVLPKERVLEANCLQIRFVQEYGLRRVEYVEDGVGNGIFGMRTLGKAWFYVNMENNELLLSWDIPPDTKRPHILLEKEQFVMFQSPEQDKVVIFHPLSGRFLKKTDERFVMVRDPTTAYLYGWLSGPIETWRPCCRWRLVTMVDNPHTSFKSTLSRITHLIGGCTHTWNQQVLQRLFPFADTSKPDELYTLAETLIWNFLTPLPLDDLMLSTTSSRLKLKSIKPPNSSQNNNQMIDWRTCFTASKILRPQYAMTAIRLDVPRGKRMKIYQVVIECSIFCIHLPIVRFEENPLDD